MATHQIAVEIATQWFSFIVLTVPQLSQTLVEEKVKVNG